MARKESSSLAQAASWASSFGRLRGAAAVGVTCPACPALDVFALFCLCPPPLVSVSSPFLRCLRCLRPPKPLLGPSPSPTHRHRHREGGNRTRAKQNRFQKRKSKAKRKCGLGVERFQIFRFRFGSVPNFSVPVRFGSEILGAGSVRFQYCKTKNIKNLLLHGKKNLKSH